MVFRRAVSPSQTSWETNVQFLPRRNKRYANSADSSMAQAGRECIVTNLQQDGQAERQKRPPTATLTGPQSSGDRDESRDKSTHLQPSLFEWTVDTPPRSEAACQRNSFGNGTHALTRLRRLCFITSCSLLSHSLPPVSLLFLLPCSLIPEMTSCSSRKTNIRKSGPRSSKQSKQG